MENPKFLKRRLFAIVKAALLGAILAGGTLLLDDTLNRLALKGYLGQGWKEFTDQFGMLLLLPTFFLSPQTGNPLNPYLVNGLLAAFVFASVAAFWQFGVKDYDK